jgi:hypothetical protein
LIKSFLRWALESQEVDQQWRVDWKDFLVTNYDVVYASIDGRGTGFQVGPLSSS